ncbi:MAG: carboxypeptidase-like regulatory domain-containing protein, partial [Bacteroidetes bacterium]|nr:carboxypeptidase-like regulatory domain-containing protein [Bacteroidota bacterium]
MHCTKYLLSLTLVFLSWLQLSAQTIVTGSVTDGTGKKLAYASVIIKGTTKGVTANADAKYSLSLAAGSYTISCNYVGFEAVDKKIKIVPGQDTLSLSFLLTKQVFLLNDVVVSSKGEDPAYAIIRKAI